MIIIISSSISILNRANRRTSTTYSTCMTLADFDILWCIWQVLLELMFNNVVMLLESLKLLTGTVILYPG